MFVDLHHHLIYGVDDGARTREEMQKMLLRAADEGISDIVCTSHATPGIHPFPTEAYLAHFQEAVQWCEDNRLPVTLHTGCEVLYTPMSARLIREGYYPTLAETNCVLVEFAGDVSFRQLCEAARMLGNEGLTVLFAHVERFDVLHKLDCVKQLREEYGAFMQMNANTILSKKGFFTERWVRKMLESGCIDCVATDAHNTTSRPCQMKQCYQRLEKMYGADTAEELCGGFQRRFLFL